MARFSSAMTAMPGGWSGITGNPKTSAADRAKLDRLAQEILAAIPGAAVAADQPYREEDLAIDFAEDVERLDDDAIARIAAMFEAAGGTGLGHERP